MIKILYLVTQSEFGGAQKYIIDLAENLPANKYIIEIAVGEKKEHPVVDWLESLSQKGFKVWRLKHVVREINLWHDFLSGLEIYRLLEKSQPDIIHLNSSKIGSTGAVMGWLYKKISGKKVKIIYTVHGFVFNEPISLGRKLFYQWSERISGHFKDKIICVSELDKITGLNHKIAPHHKFITIHNGIDLTKLNFLEKSEARKTLITNYRLPASPAGRQIRDYSPLIGTIANLYATKGLIYLIRAAKILKEKNPQVIFIVIGEGGQRKNLEREIKQLNLENVFFLVGNIDKAYELLKAFDIFCLPSVKEGFSYSVMEAMAAGLPVVATSVGGMLEIVEQDANGLIVNKEKPREITRALEKILDDPKLAEKFSHNNLEKIKNFSLEKMLRETEKVYQE
ncbi:MAG TPA: glycosyltransferase family 4 protein [bacterium]|nr:glycosyltransferase family 4 protein [bacterium]